MADTTVLALSGPGVPQFSARGIKQSLDPIDLIANSQDMIWRSVNGQLVSTVPPQMLKYKTEISGDDVSPPAVDGVWPGQIITVDCATELATAGAPQRPVVAGSDRVEDGFTFYRPQIVFMVTGFSVQKDEWGAQTSWKISGEEV